MNRRFKIFSDPVHGFISVPRGLILELVASEEVQRLRRIRQLGVGHMVFPGAEHSRFGHALGAMALMHDALTSLSEKGTQISASEMEAALAAALLHDVGHGPFSHTLEHELLSDFEHEQMSRALVGRLNERLNGRLDLALAIFDDTYERRWFHQLISSQLDMDRLDYLRRDSYYTGVVEGSIGVGRIIKTLLVHPGNQSAEDRIVVEAKGAYAVENFLIARRLMYWQVYLHKTVLAGDFVLRSVVRRVRSHILNKQESSVEGGSEAFMFFLRHGYTSADVHKREVQDAFVSLDDTDIIYSLKRWATSTDPVLADLSRRMLLRDFFRVDYGVENEKFTEGQLEASVGAYLIRQGLSSPEKLFEDIPYYVHRSHSMHEAYDAKVDTIGVLNRNGQVDELTLSEETHIVSGLAKRQIRPFICFPKEIDGAPSA
ncbi:MAG: HD domain-containing protein [Bacteroidetes bacterium]|nr:HD domain-containing protein [Bacteroidota bacterium]